MPDISLMGDHQKLVARVRDLERVVMRIDNIAKRMEDALDAMDAKRGPGRPRKDKAA